MYLTDNLVASSMSVEKHLGNELFLTNKFCHHVKMSLCVFIKPETVVEVDVAAFQHLVMLLGE